MDNQIIQGTEVISKRDMFTKHYDLGNGKFQAVLHSYPVHYNDNGEWKDIDLNIKDMQVWEFTHGVVENLYHAYFNDTTSGNIHLISFEFINKNGVARWVNYKLKDALPDNYSVDSNKLTYHNCFPNIDAEYLVVEKKLKENIILKQKPDMTEFVFTLKMDGVKLELTDNGDVIFYDVDTNEELWKLDKPYMKDINDNINYGVEYSLGNDGEFDTLKLKITDINFLDNAIYPIIIDPTTTIQGDNIFQDTYTDSFLSNANFGNNTILKIYYYSVYDYYPYIFIRINYNFNLIPHLISRIYLSLYKSGTSTLASIKLNKVLSNWDESTITWNKQPQTEYLNTVNINSNRIEWINIDITSYKELINNYGLMLNTTSKYSEGFYSSEYTNDLTLRPKIIIEYFDVGSTICFHNENGEYFTTVLGDILQYLDFGTITAGQTSLPKKIYIQNLTGATIKNLEVWVEQDTVQQDVTVEISQYDNPFIPEDIIHFNGTFDDMQETYFYVRVSSKETVTHGGMFEIRTKAEFV